MSIGKNVKWYRKKRGLTQIELAQKASFSRSYLADIEADRYNPSVDTLKSIANALQIGLHVLLDEEIREDTHTDAYSNRVNAVDLKKLLESDCSILFADVPIENEMRQRVIDILTGLLWETREKNKKESSVSINKDNSKENFEK